MLSLPKEKITEILALLQTWKCKKTATKRQLQSLLGKLHHVSKCVRPARLFVSRMLDTLRTALDSGHVQLSAEFQKDIAWFLNFMPAYNGVNMMNYANMADIGISGRGRDPYLLKCAREIWLLSAINDFTISS